MLNLGDEASEPKEPVPRINGPRGLYRTRGYRISKYAVLDDVLETTPARYSTELTLPIKMCLVTFSHFIPYLVISSNGNHM